MADVEATIAGLDALSARVDAATRQAAADVLHAFQAAVMVNAPVGKAGNSTNMPGDLRRSVMVDGPSPISAHTWEGQVGPTMIYSRQRELGGAIFPKVASRLRFVKYGTVYYRMRVYQAADPYTKRGYEEVLPSVDAIVDARIAVAIGG